MTFEQLQKEVGEWSKRNFPGKLSHQPLLGLIEEVFDELECAKSTEASADAIGDATIFLADYCVQNDLALTMMGAKAVPLGIAIGRLCHYHLKGEQGIRHTPAEIKQKKQNAVQNILLSLSYEALKRGIPFDASVLATWETVKQRDWQKNRKDGQ